MSSGENEIKKITDVNFKECVDYSFNYLRSDDKFRWAPKSLLKLWATARNHYSKECQIINKKGVPSYKVRNCREMMNIHDDYCPSLGKLSRIAKRWKAKLKSYKRAQEPGYHKKTLEEVQLLTGYLNLTLSWDIHPQAVDNINKYMAKERRAAKKRKREVAARTRKIKARDKKDDGVIKSIYAAAENDSFGWDMQMYGNTFLWPVKNGKLNINDIPVALHTARILLDVAADVIPDSEKEILMVGIVLTGEGHREKMPVMQQFLMEDNDLFTAALYDEIANHFAQAGFLK